MDRLIANELKAVPGGPANSAENLYRMSYAVARLNSLGVKAQIADSPEAVRDFALHAVRKEHPHFELSAEWI